MSTFEWKDHRKVSFQVSSLGVFFFLPCVTSSARPFAQQPASHPCFVSSSSTGNFNYFNVQHCFNSFCENSYNSILCIVLTSDILNQYVHHETTPVWEWKEDVRLSPHGLFQLSWQQEFMQMVSLLLSHECVWNLFHLGKSRDETGGWGRELLLRDGSQGCHLLLLVKCSHGSRRVPLRRVLCESAGCEEVQCHWRGTLYSQHYLLPLLLLPNVCQFDWVERRRQERWWNCQHWNQKFKIRRKLRICMVEYSMYSAR